MAKTKNQKPRKSNVRKKTPNGRAKSRDRKKTGSQRGARGSLSNALKPKTVYRDVYSQRQGRTIALVRTEIKRSRVKSLRTRTARTEVSKEIVANLRAWRNSKKSFKGKAARANIELRIKDSTGHYHSKWISFKRQENLDNDSIDDLSLELSDYVSNYMRGGMEVVGFRNVEFEAVKRPKKRDNTKTTKRKKSTKPKKR